MQPQFRQVPPSVGSRSTTADLEAELGGADRGDVAAGAGADDDDIVVVGHDEFARWRAGLAPVAARKTRDYTFAVCRGLPSRPSGWRRLDVRSEGSVSRRVTAGQPLPGPSQASTSGYNTRAVPPEVLCRP